MNGKISTTVLLLAVLFTVQYGYTTKPLPPFYFEFDPLYPIQFSKPIHIVLKWYLDAKQDNASVTISLPSGVSLLSGELEWHGKMKPDSMYRMELTIEISEPGTYEVTSEFNPSQIHGRWFEKIFPLHPSRFFFVREDTIAVFWSRSEMDQAIRDSLVFPGVATRRYYARANTVLQERRTKRAKMNEDDSLAQIIRIQLQQADSVAYAHLSDTYTPEQITLIKQYHLMYARPQFEHSEQLLNLETHGRLSNEELARQDKMFQRHFMAKYELEQRIIHTEQTDTRMRLLAERDSLFKNQATERKAILKPEK